MEIRDIFQAVLTAGVLKYFWDKRLWRKQSQVTQFASYSSRYTQVLGAIAQDIGYESPFNPSNGMHRRLALEYFFLLSEEMHLHSEKLIDDKTWGIWKSGVNKTMSHPFFKSAWPFCTAYADFEGKFGNWIENELTNQVKIEHPKAA